MKRLIPMILLLAACTTTAPVTPTPAPPATTAQAAAPCNPGLSMLESVLWVQNSAEYRASALQTFGMARRALDEALADRTRVGALEETNADPDQPPAIITDADETVLDNTRFETRALRAGKTFDQAIWKQWVEESAAGAVPGAAEFLAYAKSKGVTIFYVTNRDENERAGTRRNLEKLGFPMESFETLLLRTDPQHSDKSDRRKAIADKYRIVLLLGDDLNDFANMRSASREERDALVTKTADWWGTRWFIIPNPMYGSFDRAAVGSGGTPCEVLERKVKALVP